MRKRWALGVLTVGCLLLASGTTAAQVSREEFEALQATVELLREAINGQAAVLKQLLERAGALREPPDTPFREVVINVDGVAFDGEKDAKVTIVEFADYRCPFCGRYSQETFPQLARDYIETGPVKYVFRDFPIETLHPQAFKAHEAVHRAGDQGKRRAMHEKVFANQRAISEPDLHAYARTLGLDTEQFQKCLAEGVYAARIREGVTDGEQAGVTATPTFFLGLTQTDSPAVKAVRKIEGAQSYRVFKVAIEELLSSRSSGLTALECGSFPRFVLPPEGRPRENTLRPPRDPASRSAARPFEVLEAARISRARAPLAEKHSENSGDPGDLPDCSRTSTDNCLNFFSRGWHASCWQCGQEDRPWN